LAVSHAATLYAEVMEAFSHFAQTYNKKYADAEWTSRMAIFAENLERINEQNKQHILIGGDAVFGVTQFSDLTPAEFKGMYLNYIPATPPCHESISSWMVPPPPWLIGEPREPSLT